MTGEGKAVSRSLSEKKINFNFTISALIYLNNLTCHVLFVSLGTENVLKHFNQNSSVIKILQINLNSVFVIRLLSNEIDHR